MNLLLISTKMNVKIRNNNNKFWNKLLSGNQNFKNQKNQENQERLSAIAKNKAEILSLLIQKLIIKRKKTKKQEEPENLPKKSQMNLSWISKK